MKNDFFLTPAQIVHNIRAYKYGTRHYKVVVTPRKKIFGYTFITIGLIPNGCGWFCFPIGFMFLRNQTFKSLTQDLKYNLYKIHVSIRRKIRGSNTFKYFKNFN